MDRLFTQTASGYLVPTLRLFTNQLINLSLLVRLSQPRVSHTDGTFVQAGRENQDSHLVKAGEAARMLARPIGVAANDR